jgi:chemotaxis protein methyltransferase CheR
VVARSRRKDPPEAQAVRARHGDNLDVEAVEAELLLEALYRVYGYDFRHYARASIRRRLWHRAMLEGLRSISALQDRVLHDRECMERLLHDLSVTVTSMFRDPGFFRTFADLVVPVLRTYPFIRIWNAGCSTGEEAFSMAILLHEHGLHDRSQIYATDMNESVLERARSGAFPLAKMREYTANYMASGGKRPFSDYYVAKERSAVFDPKLVENVVFARHNLVSDGSFNEFNVVLCRNVMIYFDSVLRDEVHELLYDSLVMFGTLALGSRESIHFSRLEHRYESLHPTERLYRKVA